MNNAIATFIEVLDIEKLHQPSPERRMREADVDRQSMFSPQILRISRACDAA
jgi:hypothetical protein